jgi:hypothetical protein
MFHIGYCDTEIGNNTFHQNNLRQFKITEQGSDIYLARSVIYKIMIIRIKANNFKA